MLTVKSLTIAEPVPIDPVQRVVLRDAALSAAQAWMDRYMEKLWLDCPQPETRLLCESLARLKAATGSRP